MESLDYARRVQAGILPGAFGPRRPAIPDVSSSTCPGTS